MERGFGLDLGFHRKVRVGIHIVLWTETLSCILHGRDIHVFWEILNAGPFHWMENAYGCVHPQIVSVQAYGILS